MVPENRLSILPHNLIYIVFGFLFLFYVYKNFYRLNFHKTFYYLKIDQLFFKPFRHQFLCFLCVVQFLFYLKTTFFQDQSPIFHLQTFSLSVLYIGLNYIIRFAILKPNSNAFKFTHNLFVNWLILLGFYSNLMVLTNRVFHIESIFNLYILVFFYLMYIVKLFINFQMKKDVLNGFVYICTCELTPIGCVLVVNSLFVNAL